ncbi:MAG: substrate-binding domain-containing protein [Gemmatimonadales bacterium]
MGVSLPTAATAFYQDLTRGLQAAADSLGLELHISQADGDATRQTAQVDSLLARRVDALVLAPVSSRGSGSAVEAANRTRIPVFTTDIPADAGRVVTHVVSDHRQGGRSLGEYVARRLDGGGNVVILDQPTEPIVRDRVAGFLEALARYPNIRIVARPAVERGQRDLARRRMADLLATDQRIDAVFCTNDDCALGALAAVQTARRTGLIVVGYDATPEARTAISGGTALVADAAQDPLTIGRRTIEAVATHLRGGTLPPLVLVRVGLVERESRPAL